MNNREIRRRIASIRETVKITRAMYSISVAKMTLAKTVIPQAERFYEKSRSVLLGLTAYPSPYFIKRGERTAFIVIGGDKGLCGDYNQKVFEAARAALSACEERYLFIVGGVVREKLSKVGIEADVEFLHSAERPSPEASYSIAADLVGLFDDDMLDEIRLLYSTIEGDKVTVKEERLLPVLPEEEATTFEDPVTDGVIERAVYGYIASSIYRALVSSSMAEHFARMLAMPQASENGEKMIAELTSAYNKARQEGITRALADVGARESNAYADNE